MAGLDADRRQPVSDEASVQPLRERSRLQADALDNEGRLREVLGDGIGIGADLGLTYDPAGRVENA